MERIVNLHIEKLPEGFYLATSDEVQGLGRSRAYDSGNDRDCPRRSQAADWSARNTPFGKYASAGCRIFRFPNDCKCLMGRLAGFRYREIVKRLKQLGFEFDRQAAGSHEIWFNPEHIAIQRFPIIPGICQKAHYAPFSSKPVSSYSFVRM